MAREERERERESVQMREEIKKLQKSEFKNEKTKLEGTANEVGSLISLSKNKIVKRSSNCFTIFQRLDLNLHCFVIDDLIMLIVPLHQPN